MKQHRWQLASVLCGLIATLHGGAAVEVTSETFVGSAAQIAGNDGTGTRLTTFSMRSIRPMTSMGTISALETSALVDSRASWTNDQYNGSSGSYYVEFESGLVADIIETDGAGKRLVFPGALGGAVTSGSKYRIRKHQTLADVFGPANEAAILGGRNSAEADSVMLYVPQTQESLKYYYRNISGFSGWYRGSALSGDTVIYPEQGIMVERKTNTTVTVYWAGAVKQGATTVPVFAGYNLVGTLKSRTPMRLADLNLITGDPNTGLAGGANAAEADTVLLLNGDGSTSAVYYRNLAGFSGWRNGSQVADDLTLNPGTAFYLYRKSPRGSFFWNIPSE